MNLRPANPLRAQALAKDIDVAVWSVNQIDGLSDEDLRQLTDKIGRESWSAFTLRQGDLHLIVYNSGSSAARANSVIMHELSHIMLGHELISVEITKEKFLIPSTYNQLQENEADWLAGTLLLPRPALLDIRRQQLTDEQAKEKYQVSQDMLTWRFRMTGVDYQLGRVRRYS